MVITAIFSIQIMRKKRIATEQRRKEGPAAAGERKDKMVRFQNGVIRWGRALRSPLAMRARKMLGSLR